MFDRIARRYDLLNAILSMGLNRLWLRRAAAGLGPCPGGRYLDIGCGTGQSAMAILRRCPSASVVGIDPSEEMLAVGRRRTARAEFSHAPDLRQGVAERLEFPDGAFAGVLSAYCLRNLSDRGVAFAEIRRVLAPGGTVVLLDLTVPRRRLLRAVHRLYLRRVVPPAGALLAGSRQAYQYLADSILAFPPAGRIVAELAAAGLADPRAIPVHGGIVTLFAASRGDGSAR